AKTYTFNVTPAADGTVNVNVAGNVAQDTAGNFNAASNTFSITFTGADTVAPTVALTTSATNPTSTNPIPFAVTFSAIVTGFDASDLTITNGTVLGFTAVDAKNYTFKVTASAVGNVTVSIPANAAQDSSAQGNLASNVFTITFNG